MRPEFRMMAATIAVEKKYRRWAEITCKAYQNEIE